MPRIKKLKPNKAKCDKIFSEIIRKAGKCLRCQNTYNLQTAHIFSRGYYTIRWDLDNAVCLCSKCHVYFTFKPIQWELWVVSWMGQEKYDNLKKKALEYKKINYDEVMNYLIKQIEAKLGG